MRLRKRNLLRNNLIIEWPCTDDTLMDDRRFVVNSFAYFLLKEMNAIRRRYATRDNDRSSGRQRGRKKEREEER